MVLPGMSPAALSLFCFLLCAWLMTFWRFFEACSMRILRILLLALALTPLYGVHAQTKQTPAAAQSAGNSLGNSAITSGPLTPAASSSMATTPGAQNVWGSSYTGNADPAMTGQSNASSMIAVGNNAKNKSVNGFKQYDGKRDDQANQATYFLNRTPVLKPTISTTDPMVVAAHSGVGQPVFASSTEKVCKQTEVKTTYDNSTISTCLETYTPYVVPCETVADVSFANVPAPLIAGTIQSYSCPAGETLSGVSCAATTSKTYPAAATESCSAGQMLSGSNCIIESSTAAEPFFYCPAGQTSSLNFSWFGNNALPKYLCRTTITAPTITTNDCPTINYGGGYWTRTSSNGSPMCFYTLPLNGPNIYTQGFDVNYKYTCEAVSSQGYGVIYGSTSANPSQNISGCMVYANLTNVTNSGTDGYSCPLGSTHSGSSCVTTSTTPATLQYSCPSGGTLSGSSCTIATTTISGASPNYACPTGFTLSGSICTGSPSDLMVQGTTSGCGALEGLSN